MVIEAFQVKAIRRELCGESAADFYLFSYSYWIWNRFEGLGSWDILGEDLSCIHGSTTVARNPNTGFIYAVMGGGAP